MKSLACSRSSLVGALLVVLATRSSAQTTSVPGLSSRPGAAYTLYLDFGGFNYTGTWANKTPGVVPAFSADGDLTNFSAADVGAIREAWARTAQKYTSFNVNVTTVDPAIAAGMAASDAQRQTYYGQTARMMHTIIGGSNAWYSSGAGGVSYVGTTAGASGAAGHTNWVFPNNLGRSGKNMGEAISHENGHGLGLNHQTDQVSGANYSTNNGASGNGSYAPTMGVTYNSQRGTWRVGAQNDVARLLANNGMGGLIESGIGHSLQAATAMPTLGSTVDFRYAQGIINPKNGGANGPLGVENYVDDYFSFFSLGGAVNLTTNEGSQFLTPGQADPGATLDSTLTILDASGTTVGQGIADVTTLKKTFAGTLAAGKYYAKISARGGYKSTYEPNAPYFTMGSYFMTGSGISSVPEPATLATLALGIGVLSRRRRRKA